MATLQFFLQYGQLCCLFWEDNACISEADCDSCCACSTARNPCSAQAGSIWSAMHTVDFMLNMCIDPAILVLYGLLGH